MKNRNGRSNSSLDSANPSKKLLQLLEYKAEILSSKLLSVALKSPNQATRLFAARLLEQRGQISTALAQDLCTDPFVKVREVAVRTLIEKRLIASSEEIQKIFKEAPPSQTRSNQTCCGGFLL